MTATLILTSGTRTNRAAKHQKKKERERRVSAGCFHAGAVDARSSPQLCSPRVRRRVFIPTHKKLSAVEEFEKLLLLLDWREAMDSFIPRYRRNKC